MMMIGFAGLGFRRYWSVFRSGTIRLDQTRRAPSWTDGRVTLFLIILGVFGVVCALVAWSACALNSSEWSLPDDAGLADYAVDSAEESEV